MAKSLIAGMVNDDINVGNITVIDRNEDKLTQLSQCFHVNVDTQMSSHLPRADIVLICVKPQSIDALMPEIKQALTARSPLIISIAAGVPIAQFESWLGQAHAIVRAMPNTPALIGAGATAIVANAAVSRQQLEYAEMIFRKTGMVITLKDECLIDVVTATSGSGPAYFFAMMEAMIQAAQTLGLEEKEARLLVTQTAFGAAKMALESPMSIARLRNNVTSKGGVTAAALLSLEASGFNGIIEKAMKANMSRSGELARMFELSITKQ